MTHLVEIPGKGLGLVAAQDYKAGDKIIEESVTLFCSRQVTRTQQAKQLLQQFRRLHTVDKIKVRKLFCLGNNTVFRIFSTNSFSINSKYCGLFIKTSRINHSCIPNACYNCNGSFDKQVTAIRSIAKGQEISISYIDKFWQERAVREQELASWSFQCYCQVCDMPEEEQLQNDNERKTLALLNRQIEDFVQKVLLSFKSRFGMADVSDEEVRDTNCDVIVHIKDILKQAETRVELVESLEDQMLLLKFPTLLDCLLLYLRARSLGVLVGWSVEKRIVEIGEVLSRMSDWNIDWRNSLCCTLARAYLFDVTWTYGT